MITKQITKIFSQETARVKSITFHPLKSIFLTGLHNGIIKSWDYQSNACMYEFVDHEGSVRSVVFHPQGDFFISGGDDKVIRMWDYTNRKLLKKLKGHTDFIRSLDFHPTKPWIISSSDDQTVRIWNFMTGKCLATATGHSHYVMSAKFLNENTVISGSLDQSIRLWSCDGLLEQNKKATFVPDVVVKQIVSGHDRGINCIGISDDFVATAGDDREVKLWTYNGNELIEKETFYNHQGCITSVVINKNLVLSAGEDGLLCVYNIDTRKCDKVKIDERFWTVSFKNSMFVAGHDSGFDIFSFSEPKLVCKSSKGFYYLKKDTIFFTDLKSEKRVCQPEGLIISMHSIEDYLLIQYDNRFEIYKKRKFILKEYAEGVLLCPDGIMSVVVNDRESVYVKSLENQVKKVININTGNLKFGGYEHFFISREKSITRYNLDGIEDQVSTSSKVINTVIGEKRYAFISKNEISIYDHNMNCINSVQEIVNINTGFFYNQIFIYATTKHIKYIFEEEGVIRSIDSDVFPFHFDGGLIYYVSHEGIESVDIELTEIEFKKLVINGEDIKPLIESGSLPGLSPLSFLIKSHKGKIALPYIKDKRQRFELCLSNNNLDECLQYCRQEEDHNMYKKLLQEALKSSNVEIAEECLIFLKDWYELYMLYVCSGQIEKLDKIYENVDDQTKKMIKLFSEDVNYFFQNIYVQPEEKEISNAQHVNTTSDVSELETIEDSIAAMEVSKPTDKLFDYDKLLEIEFFSEDTDAEEALKEGIESTTVGNFLQALERFKFSLYKIAYDMKDENDYDDERKLLGSYISGLTVELQRRQDEDDLKNIVMAMYFASLPLKDEHKKLAMSGLVYVCLKKGNFLQAKEVAKKIYKEDENVVKVVKKALNIENDTNKYTIPSGSFCIDVMDVKKKYKTCRFCYVKNHQSDVCSLCKIGYLQ